MMSNVSCAPGPRWRRARIETRAWSSASRHARRRPVRSQTPAGWRGAPNVRSNAVERHPDVAIERDCPPAVPCGTCTPTTRKPRPPIRTGWPSGSRSGKSASTTLWPTTTTCAPLTSSSRVKKRPRSIPMSRMSGRVASRAVDGRVLERAAARADVGRALRRRGVDDAIAGDLVEKADVAARDVRDCVRASRPARGGSGCRPRPSRRTNVSLPKARALAWRADRARPSSPVCTTAVVATAAAMASPASEARSGLRARVASASDTPSIHAAACEERHASALSSG